MNFFLTSSLSHCLNPFTSILLETKLRIQTSRNLPLTLHHGSTKLGVSTIRDSILSLLQLNVSLLVLDCTTNTEFWIETGGDLAFVDCVGDGGGGERASEFRVAAVGDCGLSDGALCEWCE